MNYLRQIVLDTETTGLNKSGVHYEGHRIVEIGAVELINRRLTGKNFHVYLNPGRLVDPEAFKIHGISDIFLSKKPIFSDIVNEFINFVRGSELIIHNAQFDIGFLNYELSMIDNFLVNIESLCSVIDTLFLARKKFPGRRNSLDALCERYSIDRSRRALHNAMIDAKILASIFLLMTGGQTTMQFIKKDRYTLSNVKVIGNYEIASNKNCDLKVIYANREEIIQHKNILDLIQKQSAYCMWYSKCKDSNT
ncbi:DNA polymerase III subunit epsilon [Blochmannia endosymbiont of Colobopsis nipponica]|uniref:DNA polymerase III subunit epsilon n=1 Tax=Blochmannia endosymbiont of Colobopsis nipponica TaxID=2681987 RepID=UPI001CE33749|nr:DNA polymerase III subunit epsilon [Blochmannia endosymbiont of Colobopsis nipponica]